MTLVPLTYKNFVKNKVKNTIKIKYKESDTSTYVYDNNLDSKAIINIESFNNISTEEVGLQSNQTDELELINRFFSQVNSESNFKPENSNYNYFQNKEKLFGSTSINNDNLKSFNFRNKYKIERVEQKFLPQSFELQKKNYVKNSLYKEYQKNYSFDYYNNLEHGFCNWNSINFFSQNFESDRQHTNCIVWPNTKMSDKNQYSFINDSSFNLTFYFNLRKNYNTHENPECVFHIPNLISIYFVRSYNLSSHKIAIILGDSTREKLVNITNYNSNTNNEQILADRNVYVSSDLNILNNRWYNLSLNFNSNAENSRNLELYIDGVLKFETDMTITRSDENLINSYICLGNRPNYTSNSNYHHVFYQFFARNFDKDISLGKNNIWNATGDENLDVTSGDYQGNIAFEKSLLLNSESFHGEIHDIRIYNNTLEQEKIEYNCNNVIENINTEISDHGLEFYIPVYYVPAYTHKKESFNASPNKVNLRYASIYNPVFANTCGGLNITTENYLIDFVNHTKPNVVIGGAEESYVYNDNLANSVASLIDNEDDILKIKKGVLTQTIYNENLNNSNHSNRDINLDSNLTYRNLLILPNDNGIQNVTFNAIKEFLENYNSVKYESDQVDNSKLFNINTTDIFSKNYFNRSWRSSNIDLIDNVPNLTCSVNAISLQVNSQTELFFNSTLDKADINFTISNIIFHDDRITDIQNINISDNLIENYIASCKEKYTITESNPVFRNYNQLLNNTQITSNHLYNTTSLEYKQEDINYLKLPIPYSVFNVDYDSIFTTIFDISNKLYNTKIKKNSFSIKDNSLTTTNNKINLSFKDNSKGGLYRSDCLTKVAEWNYVGHVFYNDGIVSLNRPELHYFGKEDFECEFDADFMMYVHEINIPADKGLFDLSSNTSYDKDLRQDESAFNSEDSFVYITDINLHDENLNVVARARLARPAPKKKSDSILFRLKMDY